MEQNDGMCYGATVITVAPVDEVDRIVAETLVQHGDEKKRRAYETALELLLDELRLIGGSTDYQPGSESFHVLAPEAAEKHFKLSDEKCLLKLKEYISDAQAYWQFTLNRIRPKWQSRTF